MTQPPNIAAGGAELKAWLVTVGRGFRECSTLCTTIITTIFLHRFLHMFAFRKRIFYSMKSIYPLNFRYIHHSWVLILNLFICFQEKPQVYPELSQQRPAAALAGDTLQCLLRHGQRFYSRFNHFMRDNFHIGVIIYCAFLVPSAPMLLPWVDCCVYCMRLATTDTAPAFCMHLQPRSVQVI